MKSLKNFYLNKLHNKYGLTFIVFLVWMIFFDTNNLIDRVDSIKQRRKLKSDIEYFKLRIETDSKNLKELKTNPEVLEKFGREQYFMKKDDEDIFIIVKD
ncbi:MAG TPA: septum formation initiator family protein [Salinivirgaceae bacterium]|nr:septum formation initiator family protein [Salinivirgaceae bacterium]HQA76162.1 septum formation initiator family protein [Salinivirgaceae bacterium]